MRHLFCHFNTPRGRRSIARRIKSELDDAPDARVIVLMDYFWLPAHYYQERYGMDWLRNGVHIFLAAGAVEVTLPYDGGWANLPQGSDMSTMLAGAAHEQIQHRFTSLRDNILWVASNDPEIRSTISADDNGDNEYQSAKWLHPDTPFVTFTAARTH